MNLLLSCGESGWREERLNIGKLQNQRGLNPKINKKSEVEYYQLTTYSSDKGNSNSSSMDGSNE